jgi:hypothetical protein
MTHPRHWYNGTTAADETFREIEAEWEDASTFKYAKVDDVFIIEHFRVDEGFRFAYHAQYVARATSGQRYVVASLDAIMPDVLRNFPQKFGLLFRLENNYRKLAQGLKGEWPRGARIIVSHFPLSSRLHWLVCVPADEAAADDEASLAKIIGNLGTSYGVAFQICHQLYVEASPNKPADYVSSALRGAFAGARAFFDSDYRSRLRGRMEDWQPLLTAIDASRDGDVEIEAKKLLPDTAFVHPSFFPRHSK